MERENEAMRYKQECAVTTAVMLTAVSIAVRSTSAR